jgi:hypothetical protein
MLGAMKPFYRHDGTLLVEDLQANHERVEELLNGTFQPRFWAEQFWPWQVLRDHPRLDEEYARRLKARGGWRLWPRVAK